MGFDGCKFLYQVGTNGGTRAKHIKIRCNPTSGFAGNGFFTFRSLKGFVLS